MTDRILDFSEQGAYLHLKNEQLVIERKDEPSVTTPLSEVAAIILDHPQTLATQPLLARLMHHGGVLIIANESHMPTGMMLPLQGHSVQTERFAAQAAATVPTKKKFWKQIVKCKIRAQGELLQEFHETDHGLYNLAKTVRSGDTTNREAVAARRYWTALFDDPNFRRRFDAPDQNRLLNYGYAVLRAVMGRAICAAGLHPSLGLHHHNRYNAFCLVDDLIEPYRPLIDRQVVEHVGCFGSDAPLDRAGKQVLLEAILKRYDADGEVRTLFDICARTAVSLAQIYLKESDRLAYPKILGDAKS